MDIDARAPGFDQESSGWVGEHQRLPDETGRRAAEGGRRLAREAAPRASDAPRVSIVTVARNSVKTIERAIQSVLAQGYANIEYIIIDGASDDGTLDAIRNYEDRIDYFISEPDAGVYAAMNKGLSLARGDFIALLNADDAYDPDFIASLVRTANATNADIVCGGIEMNGTMIRPREISVGVYFGHLNYFHGAFLVRRACYEKIGPYSEDFRVASDALWVQRAFERGASFALCEDATVNFADGGLSSGDTPERRELLISEMAAIYRRRFPFLTESDARVIYVFRFNKKHAFLLETIVRRYSSQSGDFKNAIAGYVRHCLRDRPGFLFDYEDVDHFLPVCVRVAALLEIDLSEFQFNLPDRNIGALIAQIDALADGAEKARRAGKKILLHYAEIFSRPSETFVFDLLSRLRDSGWAHNIILCDERRLADARPYEHCLELPWPDLPNALSNALYRRLFDRAGPDALICHFAASGRWLYSRLTPLDIALPTIHMTHGIDVFAISTNPEYREFIQRHAVLDPQTEFTAVSEYLATELIARGVPAEKVTVLPNVIHPRFFEHRKTTDFFDGSRALRLLNIGRLIDVKGHGHLLEGLRYFVDNVSSDVELTIVYGGDDRDLAGLRRKIGEFGLEGHVRLVGFVNFNEEPDFYSRFDLFIMSSTYSNDEWKRSESFGIATLEAIASGLPVIVTDAGGSPEIVGEENDFATIVPHADGRAIGEAIEGYHRDRRGFRDNADYAKSRLEFFSPQKQIDDLRALIEKVAAPRLKVALFSAIASGGAGGAAIRVHESLLRSGVRSTFYTRRGQPVERQNPFVSALEPDLAGPWDLIQSHLNWRPGNTPFTINEPRLSQDTIAAMAQDADVVNLHWVARQLSVENIAFLSNLGKPVVITVRDMQPLTGGCHFFHGCEQWREDCFACPQLVDDARNIPHLTQRYKLEHWNRDNITVVTLSEHSARLVAQSPLFKGCPVEIIANPIDLETFSPAPRAEAREILDLPQDEFIAFYIPSFKSLVKGGEELRQALTILRDKNPELNLRILTAGAVDGDMDEYPFKTTNLGRITDKAILARAYAAADITLVPSLEETFSNTAAESVACGSPVVGFATGVIPELAAGGCGVAAPVGDCGALADGVLAALSDLSLRAKCRDYALKTFSFAGQGARYKALFEKLSQESRRKNARPLAPDAFPLFGTPLTESLFERQAKVLCAKQRAAVEAATEEDRRTISMLHGRVSQIRAEHEVKLAKLHSRLSRHKAMAAAASPDHEGLHPIPNSKSRWAASINRFSERMKQQRSTIPFRAAKLFLWVLAIALARPRLTVSFAAAAAAAFIFAIANPAGSQARLYSFLAGAGIFSLWSVYVVFSYLKNKIHALYERVNRNERFRQRLLEDFKERK